MPTYATSPSVTTWARLEPRTRSRGMRRGLAARVHDPLWLLGRQWQMGEFQGEDAGTPVAARLRATVDPVSRYRSGVLAAGQSAAGQLFDGGKEPLEARVEGEPVLRASAPGLDASATAGQHFLRLLSRYGAGQYREAFVAAFAFEPDLTVENLDEASRRRLSVLSGRVADGVALYRVFEPFKTARQGQFPWPRQPQIAAGDQLAVAKIVLEWLAWFDSLYSAPESQNPAWIDERLEYGFAVATAGSTGESVYSAEEYPGGRLDWFAVDRKGEASLGATASDPGPRETSLVQTSIPGPVAYPGMPAPRWWEFENANVNFGDVDAGGEDLLRMLLVEFALTYGNDWFLMAVDLPFGTLTRIQSLVVTDTFGVKTLIPPTSETAGGGWSMFQVSGDDPGLLLLPVLGPGFESQPIEEVSFLRDEMANMAWAVERRVESAAGSPLDRHEAEMAAADETPPPPVADADWRYRIATTGEPAERRSAPAARRDGVRPRSGRTEADPAAGPHPRSRAGPRALRGGGAAGRRQGHPRLPVRPLDGRLHPRVGRPAETSGPRRRYQRLALRQRRGRGGLRLVSIQEDEIFLPLIDRILFI